MKYTITILSNIYSLFNVMKVAYMWHEALMRCPS